MENVKKLFKQTATFQLVGLLIRQFEDFFETLGRIGKDFVRVLRCFLHFQFEKKLIVEQAARFAYDSLPITLSIVGMTSVIIAMQIAPEMVKQGGADYVGMLITLVIVREVGAIMSGFAIISMIGSSIASEIATMRVTEQIDAIEALKVNPIQYLFIPRIVAGTVMMPIVVVIASFVGIICGGVCAGASANVSWLRFINSVWYGLYMRDLNICLLKSAVFGFVIVLVSASMGYSAKGGAKGVGIATTKAVVWAFISIVIIDYIFALLFFF